MQNTKKAPIFSEAKQFLVSLTSEAGMDILPPKSRGEILEDLAMRLDAKLTLAALEALPTDKVSEFKRLLSQKQTPAQILSFLNKNIANIGEFYSLAISDFRKLYLGK